MIITITNQQRDRGYIIPIMNYIDVFLEALSAEKGRSKNTLVSYANDLRMADAAINDGLVTATDADIQKYLGELDACPTSIARKASALLQILNVGTRHHKKSCNEYRIAQTPKAITKITKHR